MLGHLLSVYVLAALAQAPPPRMAFPAPADGIRVVSDVAYGAADDTRLAMDVYSPPASSAAAHPPVLVFFNRATGAARSGAFSSAWARAAASRGIVAMLPDLRAGSEAADFRRLLSFLEQHRSEYGSAIAVYANSGNVSAALPAVQDPSLTQIKAAVMYYGAANVTEFRLDLPVLYVRAGLDRPPVNEAIASLVARAIVQNAPVTLLNYSGGHHAFELADDTEATRQVIDQTLAFVHAATASGYQAALHAALPEATAAGYMLAGKSGDAATAYAGLVTARPEDARLRLSYGEALLRDQQYAAACSEFAKLRDKSLGPRDLGLPAARACLAKGDPEAAVGWLRSIPPQFLAPSLQQDPSFAPLKDRDDFKALFLRKQ